MELADLIVELSRPAAYPVRTEQVVVHQTHISAVFLVGAHAYKIKKPVRFGFLDFSSPERRRFFCDEEVRLNRRLAPDVYLGVVPVVPTSAGVRVEADGEPLEWAVKMRRLPDEATLQNLVLHDALDRDCVAALARHIAAFHATAVTNEHIASFARFDAVARTVRENLEQSTGLVGIALSRTAFDRLTSLTERELLRRRPLIEQRAARGIPRDTHGDLRLEHVYRLPTADDADHFVIIDCIEFCERFRYADPVADMAFTVMDFHLLDRPDLAWSFASAYFDAAADAEGWELLPFYTAYRAAVRGKVEGLLLSEKEVPEVERNAARVRACHYWQLALEELEAE